MNKKSKQSNHCPRCGNPQCDGDCKKTGSIPKEYKDKHINIDKDKTPNRIWPTDQEKHKGPKI